MSKLKSTYSVVLRPNLPPTEKELLEHFAGKIVSKAGDELLHFLCTKVDLSHHHYLTMETFDPNDEEDIIVPLRVPHHFVLLILGEEDRKSFGFLADLGW